MTLQERIEAGKHGTDVVNELIYGRDYFVWYIDLPYHIGGASTVNHDGTYNIYINSKHSPERRASSLHHEINHCECGHLDQWRELPIEIKEWEADHLPSKILWTA